MISAVSSIQVSVSNAMFPPGAFGGTQDVAQLEAPSGDAAGGEAALVETSWTATSSFLATTGVAETGAQMSSEQMLEMLLALLVLVYLLQSAEGGGDGAADLLNQLLLSGATEGASGTESWSYFEETTLSTTTWIADDLPAEEQAPSGESLDEVA